MNNTPNYGFEKTAHLCAVGEIDRELRRVEDKVDCAIRSFHCVNRASGRKNGAKPNCRCNCEEELRDIRVKLADRYTKTETDSLLNGKVDRVAPSYCHLNFALGIEGSGDYSYCFKDPFGIVTLHLALQVVDSPVIIDRVIAILPEGYRPVTKYEMPVVYFGGAVGTITVRPNGSITFAHIPEFIQSDIRFSSGCITYTAAG